LEPKGCSEEFQSGIQEGGEDLMMAMELEMEARNPSSAAFRQPPQSAIGRHLAWVLSFAVPGLGMFTEGAPVHTLSRVCYPCTTTGFTGLRMCKFQYENIGISVFRY
jgi:hypothetical protein